MIYDFCPYLDRLYKSATSRQLFETNFKLIRKLLILVLNLFYIKMIAEEKAALDSKDLKIISMLSTYPDIPQEDIAAKLKISQPAVCMRVRRLKKLGFLQNQYGMNVRKAGLYLSKVELFTRDVKSVLKKFQNCPFLFNGFITTGRNNLCLFLICENLTSVQCIVERHLKKDPNVERVEDCVIIFSFKDIFYPLKTFVKKDVAPCGSI
ncbi:MAG: Lrp/AsnC family transcriptional regulator, partial [Nitrososphaerota archaeon]